MSDSSRAKRVAEEVQRCVSSALLTEVSDDRLRSLSVTEARMSGDLRIARLYWLPLELDATSDRELKRLERALQSATPFLRRHLGRELALRFTPELHFHFDEATRRGRAMEETLASIRTNDASDSGETK